LASRTAGLRLGRGLKSVVLEPIPCPVYAGRQVTPARQVIQGSGASKRQLESSADWHASLLDRFDDACANVKYRHRPVRLTAVPLHRLVVQNSEATAAAATITASQSTAACIASRHTGNE